MRVEENSGGGLAMFFPPGTALTDLGFLLMRLMVGAVFITSGWSDLRDPDARSKSIGMSKGFTIFLGASEVLGSLGVMAGGGAPLGGLWGVLYWEWLPPTKKY